MNYLLNYYIDTYYILKKRHTHGYGKLIPRKRKVHKVDTVMCHPDPTSLRDLLPHLLRVLLADSPTLLVTPFRNYLSQLSAVNQQLPGLP